MADYSSSSTFYILKDCVAFRIIQASYKPKKIKGNNDGVKASTEEELAAELDDFILYLTQEIYEVLPDKLKSTESSISQSGQELGTDLDFAQDMGVISMPPSFHETVITYSLVSDEDTAEEMFRAILSTLNDELVSIAEDAKRASLPPSGGWRATRGENCELCGRAVPLTYHHLIPRSTHDKVLKRKWHPPEMLNVVAWLCRPCHNAVHRSASNEDLAHYYYNMDLLNQLESIQKWASYASRQRWGVRRG